ncbi:MAG: Hemin transport system permease protein HmuU [Candidatus Erwinia impunctatus]|nr:Hemin transport system permease protein HmuU [Culicoides impunctatus]
MKSRKHYHLALASALFALPLVISCSILQGAVAVSWPQLLSFFGVSNTAVSDIVSQIVVEIRIPRTLLALCTGAGLAVVGALLQTTTRNDLADPFLFGLSSGASAGAVIIITRLGEPLGAWTLPVAAFSGGICSALVVMLLFHIKKQQSAAQLIICGLAISFLFGAITSYFIFSGDQRAATTMLFWSLGGLGLANWQTGKLAKYSICHAEFSASLTVCRTTLAPIGCSTGGRVRGTFTGYQRQPPAQ